MLYRNRKGRVKQRRSRSSDASAVIAICGSPNEKRRVHSGRFETSTREWKESRIVRKQTTQTEFAMVVFLALANPQGLT